MMKHKFVTETLGSWKAESALIINDDNLSPEQKKEKLNDVRLRCMGKYSYYSRAMKELDSFIKGEMERQKWLVQRARMAKSAR